MLSTGQFTTERITKPSWTLWSTDKFSLSRSDWGKGSAWERRFSSSSRYNTSHGVSRRWNFAGQAYRVPMWHYCISKRARTLYSDPCISGASHSCEITGLDTVMRSCCPSTKRLSTSRSARAIASEASGANKSCASRGGVVSELARCRSSAGARWQVGVDRAGASGGRASSWKSMVGTRSREAAVRRDSSCHAVAYQSFLTVGSFLPCDN